MNDSSGQINNLEKQIINSAFMRVIVYQSTDYLSTLTYWKYISKKYGFSFYSLFILDQTFMDWAFLKYDACAGHKS